jgi:hypothetical protein
MFTKSGKALLSQPLTVTTLIVSCENFHTSGSNGFWVSVRNVPAEVSVL